MLTTSSDTYDSNNTPEYIFIQTDVNLTVLVAVVIFSLSCFFQVFLMSYELNLLLSDCGRSHPVALFSDYFLSIVFLVL